MAHAIGASRGIDTAVSAKLKLQERDMDRSLVSRNPEITSGALCFTGTRVPVKHLFDYLEGSSSLEDFPSVSRQRAVAVIEAARHHLAADAPAAWPNQYRQGSGALCPATKFALLSR